MKLKFFAAAMLAAILLLALMACGQTQSPTISDKLDSTVQPTEQQNDSETSANEDPFTHVDEDSEDKSASTGNDEDSENKSASTGSDEVSEEEPWKTALAEELFEKYGVIPEYYEDLGDGIYQVYVEVGGEVIPFVTVDSATGDYHG